MPIVLIIALSLHVLAATFWAGTTFALARTEGLGGERLFRPQMGAAVIAILAGGYVWHVLHGEAFGRFEQVLALGAACAVIAAGIQGALMGPAIRGLRKGSLTPAQAAQRMALAQRISTGFLIVTIVCMVSARYV